MDETAGPTSPWRFPDPDNVGEQDVVGVGADLEPSTLLQAYRSGIFPMPLGTGGPLAWWSPDPRAIFELAEFSASRSLRKAARRFEIRIDTAVAEVIAACADPSRPNGWIDQRIANSYLRLHRLGFVHTVEAWQGGELAGGLYGVVIGGLFAGESMFHRRRDASKVALLSLVEILRGGKGGGGGADDEGSVDRLLDVQFLTPHLQRLGAVEIARSEYLRRLRGALQLAAPKEFERQST